MDDGVTGAPAGVEPLPHTGERMVPEGAGIDTVWEHLYRYRFAVPYARGKDVLDVACGEGYGSAALAAGGAKSVVGVDVDEDTCRHARAKYGRHGVDIRHGDAQSLPLPDDAVDVVVSFETIEHVPDPAKFLAECRRVLRPGGTLVISTPNVQVYNTAPAAEHNPYHCSEMTEPEFRAALAAGFGGVKMFVQRASHARWWHPRSLGAHPSFWLGRSGYGHLMRRSRVFRPGAESDARRDPVRLILEPDEPFLGRLVNWYRVRPQSQLAGERPTYFTAVATVVK